MAKTEGMLINGSWSRDFCGAAGFCGASNCAVFFLLTTVILFNVAAFGGVYPQGALVTQGLLLAALVIHAPVVFMERNYGADVPVATRGALAAFGAFLVYVAAQCGWGAGILDLSRVSSTAKFETLDSLTRLAYYLIFFYLCVKAFRFEKYQKASLLVIGFFAFAVTIFGWIQKLSGTHKIYWHHPVEAGSFFGPFIYENNYGAFMCLSLPITAVFAAQRYSIAQREWSASENFNRPLGLMTELLDSGALFFSLITALSLAAIIFSESRFSAFSVFLTFAVVPLILIVVKKSKRPLLAAIVGASCFALVTPLVDFNLLRSSHDATTYGSQLLFRMKLYSDSIGMFWARPWFGWGAGSFAFANTPFLTLSNDSISFTHSNNDYIELLAEMGISGAFLALLFVICIFVGAVRSIPKTPSVFARWVGLQAALALTSLGLASLFDSHLKVPALAFLCLFQFALLASAGDRTVRPNQNQQVETSTAKPRHGTRLLAILGIASMVVWLAPNWIRSLDVGRSLSLASADGLEAAIRLQPENAKLHQRMAKLQYRRATKESDPEIRRVYLSRAVKEARESAKLYPMYAYYWFVYGQLAYIDGRRSEGVEVLERAVRLSPHNRKYAAVLMSLYLTEFEKVLSPQKKRKHWKNALETYRSLVRRPDPLTDGMLSAWMMYYNATLVQKLKASI